MSQKRFVILGFTDEVTSCDLCGKPELKGTYVLQEYDAEGNPVGDHVHFGSTCGRKAAGWTATEWKRESSRALAEQALVPLEALARQIAAEWPQVWASLPPPHLLPPPKAWTEHNVKTERWGWKEPADPISAFCDFEPWQGPFAVRNEPWEPRARRAYFEKVLLSVKIAPYTPEGRAAWHLFSGDRARALVELGAPKK